MWEGFWFHLSGCGGGMPACLITDRCVINSMGWPPNLGNLGPMIWGFWYQVEASNSFEDWSPAKNPLTSERVPKGGLAHLSYMIHLLHEPVASKKAYEGMGWQQWKKTGTLSSQSLWVPGRDQVIESFKSFPVEINAGQFWNKTRFTETRPLFGFRKD